MSAIDCGVAAGPAKYTAGSPGSTRVNKKVTMMTPISVGITVTRRRKILTSMTTALLNGNRVGRRAHSQAHAGSGAAAHRSRLHDRAVVDLTVEPVGITGDIGLGRHVQ